MPAARNSSSTDVIEPVECPTELIVAQDVGELSVPDLALLASIRLGSETAMKKALAAGAFVNAVMVIERVIWTPVEICQHARQWRLAQFLSASGGLTSRDLIQRPEFEGKDLRVAPSAPFI